MAVWVVRTFSSFYIQVFSKGSVKNIDCIYSLSLPLYLNIVYIINTQILTTCVFTAITNSCLKLAIVEGDGNMGGVHYVFSLLFCKFGNFIVQGLKM